MARQAKEQRDASAHQQRRDAAMSEIQQASRELGGHQHRVRQLDAEIQSLQMQDADLAEREQRLSTYTGGGGASPQLAQLAAGRVQIDAAVRERSQMRESHATEAVKAGERQRQAADELQRIQDEMTGSQTAAQRSGQE